MLCRAFFGWGFVHFFSNRSLERNGIKCYVEKKEVEGVVIVDAHSKIPSLVISYHFNISLVNVCGTVFPAPGGLMRRLQISPLLVLPLVWQSIIAPASGQQPAIPQSGASNSRSFVPEADATNRPCLGDGERHYVPRHKGIGFEILDSESQACFVPDQEYRLLDELIDTVLS
jgi:hypothetical protein